MYVLVQDCGVGFGHDHSEYSTSHLLGDATEGEYIFRASLWGPVEIAWLVTDYIYLARETFSTWPECSVKMALHTLVIH